MQIPKLAGKRRNVKNTAVFHQKSAKCNEQASLENKTNCIGVRSNKKCFQKRKITQNNHSPLIIREPDEDEIQEGEEHNFLDHFKCCCTKPLILDITIIIMVSVVVSAISSVCFYTLLSPTWKLEKSNDSPSSRPIYDASEANSIHFNKRQDDASDYTLTGYVKR